MAISRGFIVTKRKKKKWKPAQNIHLNFYIWKVLIHFKRKTEILRKYIVNSMRLLSLYALLCLSWFANTE